MKINEVLENNISKFNQYKKYAAIIGSSPSKGARSPKLWNSAFKNLNISCHMYPMDVTLENLGKLINFLKLDDRYIGGAIAVPYKTEILTHLDKVEDEALTIGAVNSIYRNTKGELIGANTDGAGALWSLKSAYGNLKGARILIIGAGGAALAVTAYLSKSIGKSGKLYISNRSKKKSNKLIERISNKCDIIQCDWPVTKLKYLDIDILINCTSIGFDSIKNDDRGYFSLKYFSPIGFNNNNSRVPTSLNFGHSYFYKVSKSLSKNFDLTNDFLSQYKNLFVFDIIYQPEITCLLYLSNLIGHKTLNGIGMNLEQAVIAFHKSINNFTSNKLSKDQIRNLMLLNN